MTKYDITAERLWEKLLYHKIDFSMVDLKKPFPIDQLTSKNSMIHGLITEVQEEYSYEMSESQCSWAVVMAMNFTDMSSYNLRNNTNLFPRP